MNVLPLVSGLYDFFLEDQSVEPALGFWSILSFYHSLAVCVAL